MCSKCTLTFMGQSCLCDVLVIPFILAKSVNIYKYLFIRDIQLIFIYVIIIMLFDCYILIETYYKI